MAKKPKFYAVVLNDGTSDTFTDWTEAQAFIKTNPSSAQYKKHDSLEDAERYIEAIKSGSGAAGKPRETVTIENIGPGHAVAYVDGSYNRDSGQWGYGVVLFPSDDESKITTACGAGTAYADSRNVTGEVYGAMVAVQMAVKAGYRRLTICHDYQGIAAWADGAWDANKEMSRKYRDWMAGRRGVIDIAFVKIPGHTGVELNEMADRLAKQGCGLEGR